MKNQFLQGILILLCSSMVLKGLGFVYQIFVIRSIGTEAIGIVNMAHPFYMALVIFATMSMPLAISRMVARACAKDNEEQIAKIMHHAFRLVACLSIVAILVAVGLFPLLFRYLNADTRLRWCFYMLLPGIAIVPFTSVLRGYFQGKRKMLQPSLGQMAEQTVRILAGVGVIYVLKGQNVLYLAMGLALAMIIGELAGGLLLWIFYIREKKSKGSAKEQKGLFAEMLSLGVPATLTKLTSTCDMMLEAWLLPWCFWQRGASRSMAAKQYGDLSGVAFNLLAIPNILTSALATMLIPTIAQSSLQGNKQKLARSCGKALALTYMCACPIIAVIYYYGEMMVQLVFAIEGLGSVIQNLCYGAVFIYLGQTTVGILQGLGAIKRVFINNFCGSFIKIAGIYYFVYHLNLGLEGAAWGFVLGYGGQCALNLYCLFRKVPVKILWRELLLPPLLSAAFLYTLPLAEHLLCAFPIVVALTGAIFINCGAYLVILLASKTFSLKLLEDDCQTS